MHGHVYTCTFVYLHVCTVCIYRCLFSVGTCVCSVYMHCIYVCVCVMHACGFGQNGHHCTEFSSFDNSVRPKRTKYSTQVQGQVTSTVFIKM